MQFRRPDLSPKHFKTAKIPIIPTGKAKKRTLVKVSMDAIM